MDSEHVEQAVNDVRKHFDHDAAKQVLKEKYEAKMLFAAFGGMWKAGPDLLTILNLFQANKSATEAVLIDEYGNPCKVKLWELYDTAAQRWEEQMNAWYAEYVELQKER